jgi:hypothetical protein
MKWQLDMLADHSIHFYIEHMARAVDQEDKDDTKAARSSNKKTSARR